MKTNNSFEREINKIRLDNHETTKNMTAHAQATRGYTAPVAFLLHKRKF